MEVESVAAVTAALIRTTRVIISTQPYLRGRKTHYLATVYNLRFEARMSQNHSWWNPRHPAADGELLEHEQVHFAFSELAARHANAEIERIRARIQAIAATPDDAIRAATRHLQQEVDRVQKEVHARNAEFDRDTVNGRLAEGNHRWFDRVQAELERSRPESIAISSNTTSHPAH
jgi:hypothetical protein